MPYIEYIPKKFNEEHRAIIAMANQIIEEFAAQGFDLTLRQLYYQFVAADLLPNTDRSYKRLGDIVKKARLAGEMDWDAITDRTRMIRKHSHWGGPEDIVRACSEQFMFDKWEDQEIRPEVWIEKDALIGVVASVCDDLDVPYFSCRGYTSISALWRAGQRLQGYSNAGQQPMVIHLGDHDPSGMDMTRDVHDRTSMFAELNIEVVRIALNMDQIDERNLVPNPAKETDSRAGRYVAQYGNKSWELDALKPPDMAAMIEGQILTVRDDKLWDAQVERETEARRLIAEVADDWTAITGDL